VFFSLDSLLEQGVALGSLFKSTLIDGWRELFLAVFILRNLAFAREESTFLFDA